MSPAGAGVEAPPLLSGNEAIARGAWEAGVRVGAGYPGTPSTEILEALSRLEGVDTEWSPNEKVALEVAVGASLGGARALATMKHVGVNVAADPLFSAAYMGVRGGLVVVTADDPGMHSSQNEQDNRLFARHARIPLLEPATPDEARRYAAAAFDLSERHDTPVLLRTTTRLSHGTARVGLSPRMEIPLRPYRKDREKNVVLPAHGRVRHRWIEEERMPGLEVEASRWAEVEPGTGAGDVAFITAGVPYLYVKEAFPDAPVLRLGMSYPLPRDAVRAFAAEHAGRRLYVVEELEPVLEEQIRALGIELEPRPWPRWGELSVAAVRDGVRPPARRLPVAGSDPAGAGAPDPAGIPADGGLEAPLPGRPPALCPGCGHRGAFHALGRMDAIVSGDIGCYTLGALAPLDAMDACMNMGASIGMAHGLEKVLPPEEGKRVVSVIGDSTFYHSGVTGLMDVVYNKGSGTVVVLDNRTTAMTGHQDHPGTGCTLDRAEAPRVDIAGVARAVGVEDVRSLDPYDLLGAWRTLDDASRSDAPTVLVAEKPCVLKEKVTFGDGVVIDPEKCTDCHACTRLGCPAIEEADGHLEVNALLCNGCTHCQQVCADCNAGIDVSLMLELVDRGRTEEAFDVILRANPLPAISARVCPHPCDHDVNALGYPQAATYAARHPALTERFPDGPEKVSIRAVEQYVGDWALDHVDGERLAPREELGRSVAVIGSGPAGLSAAWHLRRAGARVTVFEAADAPGGMLRTGIPAFRLSRDVLDRELGRWTEIGVAFRCGVRIGRDVTLAELEAEHDAVVVAVGHHAPRSVSLAGAEGAPARVHHGLEFLRRFNRGDEVEVGRRVAIIGGGNTAIDCARAARRLGASAEILYRRTREEMPAIAEEVEEALEEGVTFRYQRSPVRVLAEGGRMSGLEHVAMAQGEPDDSGRRRPVPVDGSAEVDAFDSVILAVGEKSDLEFLSGSGVSANGHVDVNFAGATSRPGIFACGDAAFNQGTVTQAVATGRRAAELATRYLARRGT